MEVRPVGLPEARDLLTLARSDRAAALSAVRALALEEQVALVCEAPLPLRSQMLELTPAPELVIPLLPEAELCFSAKALGLQDATWILEHATPAQILACLDLDAWSGLVPDPAALNAWIAAFAEAGPDPLARMAQSLDAELVVLYLRDHVDVIVDPKEDGWQPPDGAQTLEGQFYFVAKKAADDLAPLLSLLHTLFQRDYWLYFRMLQGVVWETESDLQEWALRWRTGRLEDLGFPSWDEAMRIYGFVRPDQRAEIAPNVDALDVSEWQLPVWISELPARADSRHSVFRAVSELGDEERRAFFYAFVSIANKVAVADRMPLGEPETLPSAVEKAAEVVSKGLEFVAQENLLSAADALRGVTLERLFRVGASLDPGRLPPLHGEAAEEADDEAEEA